MIYCYAFSVMKAKIPALLSGLFCICMIETASAVSRPSERVVAGLVERIAPQWKDRIRFVMSEPQAGQVDFFRLSQTTVKGGSHFNTEEQKGRNRVLVIEGNSPVSLASGLNWYLKYCCGCSLSFCGDQLDLPDELPPLDSTVEIQAIHPHGFYMNYCTFGYSTVYWDWNRWERELDLMALNGVTIPMAMVGAEVVWRNTLRRFGYSDAAIKRFLPGPPYLAWFLMGNMEELGGPLPDEWFERQERLQHRIVMRMREYGMKPVFQGFFGMVPSDLNEKFPDAHLISQGEWNGLQRPPVLDPSDSLFVRMAKVWYEEYDKLFGETDYYGGDLFHEGGRTGGLDVAEAARRVQNAMLAANPRATWMIQAWGDNPQSALLRGLDPAHTIVVDICAEYWSRWQERKAFGGFPWIWSHLTNYGANVGLHGRLKAIAEEPIRGLNDSVASQWMVGVGATPEGIEVNPVVFDLGFEMRWRHEPPDLEHWLRDYAWRRYGARIEELERAWMIFLETAYGTYDGSRRPSESVFCAPPSLKGRRITASAWSQCRVYYDPVRYAEGVGIFLEAAESLKMRETYRYDAVDFVRQYLADLGREAYYGWVEAFQSGDRQRFDSLTQRFLDLMIDQDRLLSTHPQFHVARWLEQARRASRNTEVQDLYEYNARLLIGMWTPFRSPVRDYAHKEWGGMLRDYYLPRWSAYVAYLGRNWDRRDAICVRDGGKSTDGADEGRVHDVPLSVDGIVAGVEDCPDFFENEMKWVRSTVQYKNAYTEDPVQVAVELFRKYAGCNY